MFLPCFEGVGLICGYKSLNVIGPHNLMGSGINRRGGFVGVSMAVLEEVKIVSVGWA